MKNIKEVLKVITFFVIFVEILTAIFHLIIVVIGKGDEFSMKIYPVMAIIIILCVLLTITITPITDFILRFLFKNKAK